MTTRKFIHVGDIITGPFGTRKGEIVIGDVEHLHQLRLLSHTQGDLVRPGSIACQIKDDDRVPYAVAISTDQPSDSVHYPVFVEVGQDGEGHDVIVAIRIHMHPKERERVKAPRIHSKK